MCRYVPSVVRVGPNVKETLHDVSLDTLAKRRQVRVNQARVRVRVR